MVGDEPVLVTLWVLFVEVAGTLETERPRFKFCLWHLLSLWVLINHLTSQSCNPSCTKWACQNVPTSQRGGTNQMWWYVWQQPVNCKGWHRCELLLFAVLLIALFSTSRPAFQQHLCSVSTWPLILFEGFTRKPITGNCMPASRAVEVEHAHCRTGPGN